MALLWKSGLRMQELQLSRDFVKVCTVPYTLNPKKDLNDDVRSWE